MENKELDELYQDFERVGELLDEANAGDEEAALVLLEE